MIVIIGAGPVGNYAAYLLAKEGFEVSVFEEHKEIGKPVQCTGITTGLLKKIIKLDDNIVVNKIGKAKIFSPDKKFVEIKFKEENLIIDRTKFDNHITNMAKEQGAKFFLNHEYIENKKNIVLIKDKNNNQIKKIRFSHLIGADGSLSKVAKSNRLFGKREFWQGVQARVKLKNDNKVEFYPYFGAYAWVVPESKNVVRMGLVAKKYANTLFKNFVFKLKKIRDEDIIEYQGGIIPKYNSKIKTHKDSIYIVGDAACQVKATTGGGIVQGLLAVKSLANSIINSRNYEKDWRKKIGRELYFHLKTRNIMDKFKNKDWNKLMEIMNSKECKEILGNNSRDDIYSMLVKLLIKKPSLLRFLKYV